jgi:uncharacterized membrane protein
MIVPAKQVGDHVVAGTPIAWAWRRSPGRPPPRADDLRGPVAEGVQVGFERTMVQDVGFGIRRLVDIARRATAQPADVEAIAAEAATALRALGVDPSEVPAERRA